MERMANDRLRAEVAAELGWDPRVDGTGITVSVQGGRVTLHGTVTRFRQKREADNAARHVHGVTAVLNFVEVHIPDQDRRADADVRADVGQALALNDHIPATVQASVEASLVTLSGVAAWQAPSDDDIEQAISAAFGRSARLDRFDISADSPFPGLVVLSGTVGSWAEHDDAVAVAWSAPGITDIDDRIAVVY